MYEEVIIYEEDGVYYSSITGLGEATGNSLAESLRNLADAIE